MLKRMGEKMGGDEQGEEGGVMEEMQCEGGCGCE